MFRKIIVVVCLMAFAPVAAGAQEVAVLMKDQAVVQKAAGSEQLQVVNLAAPALREPATVLAANDAQPCPPCPPAEVRQKRTHTGLTFKEFAEVHFGDYRWVYWVGAAAAIVLIHVFAVRD